MGAFVDTSKVAVTDGDNTIWVKRRMDFGTQSAVEDTMTRIAMKDGQVGEVHFTLGAQKLALAIHNIVGWKGPAFSDEATGQLMPCTPENIRRLDPAFPLLLQAQDRITQLNQPHKDTVDPNSSTTTGARSSQASEPQPAVDSIST